MSMSAIPFVAGENGQPAEDGQPAENCQPAEEWPARRECQPAEDKPARERVGILTPLRELRNQSPSRSSRLGGC